MPPLGKELEQQPRIDDVAIREVEGYIDRIEKQVEVQQDNNQSLQQPIQNTTVVQQQDMGKVVAAQFSATDKPNITLPLDKAGVESGLKQNVYNSLRWLSEWCVFMIKKYPGRVFYMPPNNNQ